MFSWFRRRRRQKRTAHDLYGSIVTLSRQPEFYLRYGVADTVEARFELLVAHMFLYLERLRRQGGNAEPLAQGLVDEFFADMDTTMRELGVGDMAVPKKMRNLAAVFGERLTAYRAAAAEKDAALLAALLAENLGGEGAADRRDMDLLAGYMRDILAELEEMPVEALGGFMADSLTKSMPDRKTAV